MSNVPPIPGLTRQITPSQSKMKISILSSSSDSGSVSFSTLAWRAVFFKDTDRIPANPVLTRCFVIPCRDAGVNADVVGTANNELIANRPNFIVTTE